MDDPKLAAADQLYTVPPHRFVAERTTAVAAARAAGDRETATALAKLRRPSVAAWLVNLLALRRPELLEELAQLADSMRTAQRELAGRQLRQLTARRRATVAGLVAEARALGLAADPQLTAGKLPLAEVEATLQSGLADPAVAGRLRSGRLVRAMSASGFGELPPPRLRLVTEVPAGDSAAAEPAATEPAQVSRADAETELSKARAAAAAASAELDRCTTDQQAVKQELAAIEAQLAELTNRRADATHRLAAADAASLAARRAVVAARRRVGEAEATLTAAPPPS